MGKRDPHITEIKELDLKMPLFGVLCLPHRFLGPFRLKKIITGDVYKNRLKSEFLFPGVKKIFFEKIFGICKIGLLLIPQNKYFICEITRSMGEFSVFATYQSMTMISCEDFWKIPF